MADLRQQLQQCVRGRVCLMGLGNPEYGDDGVGMKLAELLRGHSRPATTDLAAPPLMAAAQPGPVVLLAGTAPEQFLGEVARGRFDNLIFLDAVDFGGASGAVVLLNAAEMAARFPQVSTHKLSLALLARCVEDAGTQAWLLGVQPGSLSRAPHLSPVVQTSLAALSRLLHETLEEAA